MKINEHFETVCDAVWKQEGRFCNYLKKSRNNHAMDDRINIILENFQIPSGKIDSSRIDSGKIHDSYLVNIKLDDNSCSRYILQRINQDVFPDVHFLMNNLNVMNRALLDNHKKSFQVIKTKSNQLLHKDNNTNEFWRLITYIEDSKVYQATPDIHIAKEAARIIAEFHEISANCPIGLIKPHVREFHSTPLYFKKLMESEKNRNTQNKLPQQFVKSFDFIIDRKNLIYLFEHAKEEGRLKPFICHNDPKLNNILFNIATNEAICIVDFDTIDISLLPYDFGDAARSICVKKIDDYYIFDLSFFEAFTKSYFSVNKNIDKTTKFFLFDSIKVITLELSIRYMIDYLNPKKYFKTLSNEEILFKVLAYHELLKDIEMNETVIKDIINSYCS